MYKLSRILTHSPQYRTVTFSLLPVPFALISTQTHKTHDISSACQKPPLQLLQQRQRQRPRLPPLLQHLPQRLPQNSRMLS